MRRPGDSVEFKNLKAELFWRVRMLLKDGEPGGITDQTTQRQLISIHGDYDERGRFFIEAKRDAEKRGVKSPDRAEAYILANAPVHQVGIGVGRRARAARDMRLAARRR